MAYSESFKDHLANPRNAGELIDANAIAEETNPVCGDRLRLSLRIMNGRIDACRFLAYGCPPTLVCGSALAEMLEGLRVEEAAQLTRQNIIDAIGSLSSRKLHAAAFAIDPTTGALSFKLAPNFEIPTDSGFDNIYDVTVQVSDGHLSPTSDSSVAEP